MMKPSFVEFFAGGGMARAGLAPDWQCFFANDIDVKKADIYYSNWGTQEFVLGDISKLSHTKIPDADLAWASFPCQDLSLAGNGRGLDGDRSGMFWNLWSILKAKKNKPKLLVLENVGGTLSSRGGQDFIEICQALASLNYIFGAVVIDAVHFVPQSRPRFFMVAVQSKLSVPSVLHGPHPSSIFFPQRLRGLVNILPSDLAKLWRWWTIPEPLQRNLKLCDLIIENPADVKWHSDLETKKILSLMSEINLAKVTSIQKLDQFKVGAVYKRTRVEDGKKFQRAEVRFDDVAGCLRTPGGGSSRQIILIVKGQSIRSRLLSKYEAAALMGYSGSLPDNYNDAYHLLGDGLAVPVVKFLSQELLLPLIIHSNHALAA